MCHFKLLIVWVLIYVNLGCHYFIVHLFCFVQKNGRISIAHSDWFNPTANCAYKITEKRTLTLFMSKVRNICSM